MKKKIYEIEQYEIKDLKQKLNEKQSKIIEHLRHQKKKKKFLCACTKRFKSAKKDRKNMK